MVLFLYQPYLHQFYKEKNLLFVYIYLCLQSHTEMNIFMNSVRNGAEDFVDPRTDGMKFLWSFRWARIF